MLIAPTLTDAVTEWLDGYYSGSVRTLRAYDDLVRGRMLPFLFTKAETTADVTPAMLTAFMRREAERPRANPRRDGDRGNHLSSSTLEATYSHLRTFWTWCETMDYVYRSPMKAVRRPVTPKLIREGFSREEIQRLLQWIAYKDDPVMRARDRAILLMLLSTGCRAEELVGLEWRHIDWANRRATVHGKGGKDRIVRIGTKAYPALRAWKDARKQWAPGEPRPSDPVWITLRRTKMGYVTLWKMVRNLADYAGVENCNVHRFRHTAASELFNETLNIKLVQSFLGHSKVATTDRYLKRIGVQLEQQDYATPDSWLG